MMIKFISSPYHKSFNKLAYLLNSKLIKYLNYTIQKLLINILSFYLFIILTNIKILKIEAILSS